MILSLLATTMPMISFFCFLLTMYRIKVATDDTYAFMKTTTESYSQKIMDTTDTCVRSLFDQYAAHIPTLYAALNNLKAEIAALKDKQQPH